MAQLYGPAAAGAFSELTGFIKADIDFSFTTINDAHQRQALHEVTTCGADAAKAAVCMAVNAAQEASCSLLVIQSTTMSADDLRCCSTRPGTSPQNRAAPFHGAKKINCYFAVHVHTFTCTGRC